ncbi:hypothetical protein AAE478_006046 [Parahypoxylon ruwenzoriense]
MNWLLEHNWRVYSHYSRCSYCSRTRQRNIQLALADAQLSARVGAANVGSSTTPAPVYPSRIIRHPRTHQSVTIQLPYMTNPVTTTQPLSSTSRKRRHTQREHSGFNPVVAELSTSRPEPSERIRSAVSSQHNLRRRPSNTRAAPRPYGFPPRWRNLSPETLRYLRRPDPFANPRMTALEPPITKCGPSLMPGSWPPELNKEDVIEAPTDNKMTLPTRLGANIWGAVTYLRDSSYNICATLSNRIRHSNRRAPTTAPLLPTTPPSPPEDEEPAPKRRKVEVEHPTAPGAEAAPLPSTPEAINDRMDIDIPSNAERQDIRLEPSFGDLADVEKPDIKLEASPPESPILSPNSAAAITAARRATKLFTTGRNTPRRQTRAQLVTPPPEDENEKPTPKTEKVFEQEWRPLPPPKYANIHEFFEHEDEHSLPGLERFLLAPSHSKIYELNSQREERLRLEQEKAEKERQEQIRIEQERIEKLLGPLGLRKAKAALITPLSSEWGQKAREAPSNGRTEQNKWQGAAHRDGVELSPHDFSRLVPPTAWLNDNAIQATLVHLATYINDAAGVLPKRSTPKCVALSSQYWSNFRSDPKNNLYPRGLSRNWGMTPANFLDINTVLLPVNDSNHWTVLVIRPTRRTVAYVDSFQSTGTRHLEFAHAWMERFLKDKYVASEWSTVHYNVPSQTNGYDCGMFVITNSIYLSLGIDPSDYSQRDMPLQRHRIAAVLLNGGFTGPFDLSNL